MKAAGTSSSLMPGPAGLASAWMIRTSSARYGRSNWLETLTAIRWPGRAENRSITDQRDHGPNLGPLYLRIRNLGDHVCGKGSATRPVLKRSLNARHLSAEKAKLDPASTVPRMKATSLGPVSCVALMSGLNVKIPNQSRREAWPEGSGSLSVISGCAGPSAARRVNLKRRAPQTRSS